MSSAFPRQPFPQTFLIPGSEKIDSLPPAPPRTFRDSVVLCVATGLGIGLLPGSPGTFGSLLGLPLAWGLQPLSPAWKALAALALFVAGIPICRRAAERMGSHDPGSVVFDEIAAFPLIYLFAPFNWKTALAGFVLFRLLDILKPWPISWFERLPGGLGIMADDAAAGVGAGLALWSVAGWLALG